MCCQQSQELCASNNKENLELSFPATSRLKVASCQDPAWKSVDGLGASKQCDNGGGGVGWLLLQQARTCLVYSYIDCGSICWWHWYVTLEDKVLTNKILITIHGTNYCVQQCLSKVHTLYWASGQFCFHKKIFCGNKACKWNIWPFSYHVMVQTGTLYLRRLLCFSNYAWYTGLFGIDWLIASLETSNEDLPIMYFTSTTNQWHVKVALRIQQIMTAKGIKRLEMHQCN